MNFEIQVTGFEMAEIDFLLDEATEIKQAPPLPEEGGIRAAARALGLTGRRLGPHHRGLYKGCSAEHYILSAQHQRNHGTVQTQTSTTPHDQSGTQGTRHSGTGAGHHPDHQAADEDQTAVRTLR
jgi:hypothetical protein